MMAPKRHFEINWPLVGAKIRASDKDLPVIQPKICFCKEDMILRLLSTFDF